MVGVKVEDGVLKKCNEGKLSKYTDKGKEDTVWRLQQLRAKYASIKEDEGEKDGLSTSRSGRLVAWKATNGEKKSRRRPMTNTELN